MSDHKQQQQQNSSVKVNIFNIKLLQNQYILMGEKSSKVGRGLHG